MDVKQEVEPSVPDYVPALNQQPATARRSVLLSLVRIFEVHGLLILTLLLVVIFSALLPRTFPTPLTAAAILQETSTVALIALGETIVIASGQFDLSIGYVIDICAVLAIGLQRSGVPWLAVVVIVLLLGLGIGAMNGLLVEYAKIDSFIATLGVGTIMYGIANWYTGGRQIVATLPPSFLAINQAPLLGIPLPAWYVAVIAIIFWAVCATFTSGWLDHRLSFAPSQVLLVGKMAIDAFLGKKPLVETICHVYELEGRVHIASTAREWRESLVE